MGSCASVNQTDDAQAYADICIDSGTRCRQNGQYSHAVEWFMEALRLRCEFYGIALDATEEDVTEIQDAVRQDARRHLPASRPTNLHPGMSMSASSPAALLGRPPPESPTATNAVVPYHEGHVMVLLELGQTYAASNVADIEAFLHYLQVIHIADPVLALKAGCYEPATTTHTTALPHYVSATVGLVLLLTKLVARRPKSKVQRHMSVSAQTFAGANSAQAKTSPTAASPQKTTGGSPLTPVPQMGSGVAPGGANLTLWAYLHGYHPLDLAEAQLKRAILVVEAHEGLRSSLLVCLFHLQTRVLLSRRRFREAQPVMQRCLGLTWSFATTAADVPALVRYSRTVLRFIKHELAVESAAEKIQLWWRDRIFPRVLMHREAGGNPLKAPTFLADVFNAAYATERQVSFKREVAAAADHGDSARSSSEFSSQSTNEIDNVQLRIPQSPSLQHSETPSPMNNASNKKPPMPTANGKQAPAASAGEARPRGIAPASSREEAFVATLMNLAGDTEEDETPLPKVKTETFTTSVAGGSGSGNRAIGNGMMSISGWMDTDAAAAMLDRTGSVPRSATATPMNLNSFSQMPKGILVSPGRPTATPTEGSNPKAWRNFDQSTTASLGGTPRPGTLPPIQHPSSPVGSVLRSPMDSVQPSSIASTDGDTSNYSEFHDFDQSELRDKGLRGYMGSAVFNEKKAKRKRLQAAQEVISGPVISPRDALGADNTPSDDELPVPRQDTTAFGGSSMDIPEHSGHVEPEKEAAKGKPAPLTSIAGGTAASPTNGVAESTPMNSTVARPVPAPLDAEEVEETISGPPTRNVKVTIVGETDSLGAHEEDPVVQQPGAVSFGQGDAPSPPPKEKASSRQTQSKYDAAGGRSSREYPLPRKSMEKFDVSVTRDGMAEHDALVALSTDASPLIPKRRPKAQADSSTRERPEMPPVSLAISSSEGRAGKYEIPHFGDFDEDVFMSQLASQSDAGIDLSSSAMLGQTLGEGSQRPRGKSPRASPRGGKKEGKDASLSFVNSFLSDPSKLWEVPE